MSGRDRFVTDYITSGIATGGEPCVGREFPTAPSGCLRRGSGWRAFDGCLSGGVAVVARLISILLGYPYHHYHCNNDDDIVTKSTSITSVSNHHPKTGMIFP